MGGVCVCARARVDTSTEQAPVIEEPAVAAHIHGYTHTLLVHSRVEIGDVAVT